MNLTAVTSSSPSPDTSKMSPGRQVAEPRQESLSMRGRSGMPVPPVLASCADAAGPAEATATSAMTKPRVGVIKGNGTAPLGRAYEVS